MPQLFPLVEICLKTLKILLTWAQISFSGDLTNEIQRRTNLASSASGRLSKRVSGSQNLMIHTKLAVYNAVVVVVVVVVDPTPPTCCQQSPAPESCGSQQSLPPGGKERLHFVGIRPEIQARKGGW